MTQKNLFHQDEQPQYCLKSTKMFFILKKHFTFFNNQN